MAKNIFRFFVLAVESDDEDDDTITHVAIELHPSAILRLACKNLISQIIGKIISWMEIGVMVHFETPFVETTWLNWWNVSDEDFPEEWEEGVIADQIEPELRDESGLWGRYADIGGQCVYFTCYHKHTGTEFCSGGVSMQTLLQGIRWTDLLAELREWWDQLWQNPASEPAQESLP